MNCCSSCARIKLSESHLDSSKSYFRLGACSTPDLQKVFAGDLPAAAGTAFHFVAVLQGSSGGGGGTVLGVPMSVMREADQDRLKVSVGVPQLHAFVIQQLAQLGVLLWRCMVFSWLANRRQFELLWCCGHCMMGGN